MADPINVPQPVEAPKAPDAQPDMALPSPVTPELAPQPAPAPPAQEKHSWLGKAAQALLTGTNVDYSYDDTGKLVTTRTPMKKGQIFRNMLAGALLGGAIGAGDPTHTFAGGAVRGAAGVQEKEEQMDALRRKQAQDAYEMRLKGVESGRAGERLDIEKQKLELEKKEKQTQATLAQAQTAMYNSEVFKNNVLSQGSSLTQHLEMKKADENDINVFKSMGLQPAFTVPEGEITDLLKKRPDAAGLMWKVADVKMGVDKDGHPTYQYVYEGYDLNKDVPLTEPTMKLWKQAGLDKSYPEIFRLKPGTKVSANNYKAFQQLALASLNVSLEKSKAEVDIGLKQAQTAESRARAIKDLAEAQNQKTALKKDQLFTDAMKAYDAAGKDISKIGAEYQGVIAEHAGKLAQELAPLYRSSVDAARKAAEEGRKSEADSLNSEAQAYARKLKDLTDLSQAAFKRTVDISKLPKPARNITNIDTEEGKKAYLEYYAEFGDAASAVNAMQKNGWTLPQAAPPPPPAPSLLERAKGLVGGAIGTVRSLPGRVDEFLEDQAAKDRWEMEQSKKQK